MSRANPTGPSKGGYFTVDFRPATAVGATGYVVDADQTLKWSAPLACRIMNVTAVTGAAKTGSPTFDVDTTTGAVLAGATVPSNADSDHPVTGAASANRNLAKGDILSIDYNDVGGATDATNLCITVCLYATDHAVSAGPLPSTGD